jgi:hypothetical protein
MVKSECELVVSKNFFILLTPRQQARLDKGTMFTRDTGPQSCEMIKKVKQAVDQRCKIELNR